MPTADQTPSQLRDWIASIDALSPAIQVAVSTASTPDEVLSRLEVIIDAAASALPPGNNGESISGALFSSLVKASAMHARNGADPRAAVASMAASIGKVVAAEGLPRVASTRQAIIDEKHADVLAAEDAFAEAAAEIALTLQRRNAPLDGLETAAAHVINLAVIAADALSSSDDEGHEMPMGVQRERLNRTVRLCSKIYCSCLTRQPINADNALHLANEAATDLLPAVIGQAIKMKTLLARHETPLQADHHHAMRESQRAASPGVVEQKSTGLDLFAAPGLAQ